MAFPIIHWDPMAFLRADTTEPFSLLILNTPIFIKREVMVQLWNRAVYRITVDGGTDRWFEWQQDSEVKNAVNNGLPDLVTGDMDSIDPKTLLLLKEKSVPIDLTPDQNYTDFSKAVKCLILRSEERKILTNLIVVITEVSGRLDQIMSQLNTLHMHKERIVLLSSNSATWLLSRGHHEIDVSYLKNSEILSPEKWIGLLPVGAPTTATTSGLKYNLDDTVMKFGGLVSSSNTFSEDTTIKVKSDQPLIWSMGLCLSNKETKTQ